MYFIPSCKTDAEAIVKNTDLKIRGKQLEVDFFLDDEEEDLSNEDQCTVCMSGLTEELMYPDMISEVMGSIMDVDIDEDKITINHKNASALIMLNDIASKCM